MAERIVFHAGFHKTGTTTIQRAMLNNRKLLRRKGIHVRTRDAMVGLCEAARAWSQSLSALDLGLVTYEAAELATAWSQVDGTVLASSEDLAGHMPGRRGVTRYDACPSLVATIADAFFSVTPTTQVDFVFTTREAEAWLASCHAQHIRATRMTLDLETYCKDFQASADLDAIVAEVRAVVPANIAVFPLEEHSDTPLAPIASFAGLRPAPLSRLAREPVANARPDPQVLDQLLAINRSDLSAEDARTAKRALLAQS